MREMKLTSDTEHSQSSLVSADLLRYEFLFGGSPRCAQRAKRGQSMRSVAELSHIGRFVFRRSAPLLKKYAQISVKQHGETF